MMFKRLLILLLLASLKLPAADYYVNPNTGSDESSGLSAVASQSAGPVKTIAKAVSLAQGGDTVYLGGFVFKGSREQLFVGKSGLPGKPIIIDGQNAVIDGCEPIDQSQWTLVRPGLYRNETIFKDILRGYEDWAKRFAFVVNGKLSRMGNSLKAPSDPYLKVEDLQPGQWTWSGDEHAFYFKTDPAKKLSDYNIEAPAVVSGVQVSGDVHYVVFRNITVKHVINDGFALTIGGSLDNKVSEIVFENITAIECCDDAMSGHGDCDVRVDGFIIDGCGTGICGQGNSINNRVYTKNVQAADIYMGSGTHIFTNSFFNSSGRLGSVIAMVWPNQYGYDKCTVELDNIFIKGTPIGVNTVKAEGAGAEIICRKSTLYGVSVAVKNAGSFTLLGSLAAGASQSITIDPASVWKADRNRYDIANITINNASYRAKEFSLYQQKTGQDAGSIWRQIVPDELYQPPQKCGADTSLIEHCND